MNLKTKILIDKFIGLPIVYVLNIVARILGFLLRINHSLDKPITKIIVSKYVGIGSIIQATPLLATLRKNYPAAKIIFLTNESNKELFNSIPSIDDVYTITDKSFFLLLKSNFKLLLRLWKFKAELFVDLEIYSNYSSAIATMSISKNRFGFFKDDKMYRMGIYTHMLYYNIKAPISQTYLQFARLLNCTDIINELQLFAQQKSNSFKEVSEQRYIIINANASDLRIERRWQKENFVELINMLSHQYINYSIVLIGSKNEKNYIDTLYNQLAKKENVINAVGKFSITELIYFISNAELMITNDSGPMHIAFALKTKTIALFGPCSPQQYGGTENTIIHYKNVYCSPCVHEFLIPPCKGNNVCMKKITFKEVMESVSFHLNSTSSKLKQEEKIEYSDGTFPLGLIAR